MELEVIQGFLGLLQKISKNPAGLCVSRGLGSLKPKAGQAECRIFKFWAGLESKMKHSVGFLRR